MQDKTYFTIQEVAKEVKLKPYVLRYWETVFPILSPRKHNGNRRMYTRNDIAIIKDIKFLLYDRGYTIKGANKMLKDRTEVEQLRFEFDGKIDNTFILKKLKEIAGILKEGKK